MFGFDRDRGEWKDLDCETHAMPESFSLLTLNIWFGAERFEERIRGFLDQIAKAPPDVLCLQEVTPRCLQLICDSEFVRSQYFCCMHPGAKPWSGYFSAVLSKHRPADAFMVELDSDMDRTLNGFVFQVGETETERFAVISTHLESPVTRVAKKLRQRQLASASQLIREHFCAAIVAGDFNAASIDDDSFIPDDFTDAWLQLHDTADREAGLTFDYKNNPYAEEPYRSRLDKVIYFNQDNAASPSTSYSQEPATPSPAAAAIPESHLRSTHILSLKGIRRVFDTPVEAPDGTSLFVSDHFGLWSDWHFQAVVDSETPAGSSTLIPAGQRASHQVAGSIHELVGRGPSK